MTLKTPQVEKFAMLLRETMVPQVTGHLKKELSEDWLEVLVSNQFDKESLAEAQQSGPVYGHCALGVLTEHLGLDGTMWQLAPRAVMEWLGYDLSSSYNEEYDPELDFWYFDHITGHVEPMLDMTVAELNDARFTFGQIADLIDYFGFKEF